MTAATPQHGNPPAGLPADAEALLVPIGQLRRWPGNARRGRIDLIRASLREHGQYRPLVVQRATGYVLVGNNTLEALEQEGIGMAAVVYVDVDDAQARRIVLVDNRSSDLADYDQLELAQELLALEGDYVGTGYDVHDVDTVAKALREAEPKPLPTGPTAPLRSDRVRIIMCPGCGESFDATSAVEVRQPKNAGGRV